jgi:hypothetical protein
MTSRHVQFAVTLAVCSCLFLSACHKGGGGEGGKLIHLNVALSVDGSGNCVQKLNGVAAVLIPLSEGDSVTFQSETGAPFVLNFPASAGSCTSPFRDNSGNCQLSFSNSSPNSGPAVGQSSTPFPYSTVSINGVACSPTSGGQPLGMRMRP